MADFTRDNLTAIWAQLRQLEGRADDIERRMAAMVSVTQTMLEAVALMGGIQFPGIVRERAPGSITPDQRLALIGALDGAGATSSRHRALRLAGILPGWQHGGDLGWLSEAEAHTVLSALGAVPEPGTLASEPAQDAP